MRCLLFAGLILAALSGAMYFAWTSFGGWGVLAVIVGGFVLLSLTSRLAPPVFQEYFREQFRQAAGPMREARITVHSIVPAAEADAVPAMLRQFEGWVDDASEDQDAYDFDVDEFLSHNEDRLDLHRYLIDLTVAPPDSAADAAWAPHAIALRPLDSEDASCCEVHEVQLFDRTSKTFQSALEFAFEEVTGEQRIRLHAGLDATIPEYQFEYAFVNPLSATVTIPPTKAGESPVRRFTRAVLELAQQKRPIRTLGLNQLDVVDVDLPDIANLTELEFLGLDGTQITDEGLRHLTPLQHLEGITLNQTAITDACVDSLRELRSLKRLFVRETDFTAEGQVRIREAINGIKVYD